MRICSLYLGWIPLESRWRKSIDWIDALCLAKSLLFFHALQLKYQYLDEM